MSVCVVTIIMFVFFFKQKTAYEMRISDWSSDVCSSDLLVVEHHLAETLSRRRAHRHQVGARGEGEGQVHLVLAAAAVAARLLLVDDEAAADREIHALGEDFALAVARGEAEGAAVEGLALRHRELQFARRLEQDTTTT